VLERSKIFKKIFIIRNLSQTVVSNNTWLLHNCRLAT